MGRLISCHIWFSNYSKEHITCIHWRNQRPLSWLICQVDSKSEELLTNHKFSIIVKEFTSVKGPQLYYQCPNCKRKLSPIQENVKAVSCSCCSTTKKARLSQQMYSCIVEFNHDSDFCWETLFCNVLKEVFLADNPTEDEIQTFLMETENFQRESDTKRTPMNIIDLNLKDLS